MASLNKSIESVKAEFNKLQSQREQAENHFNSAKKALAEVLLKP